MKALVKLIKNWNFVKKILDADEHYVVINKIRGEDVGEHSIRTYEYLTNTNRDMFFKIVMIDMKERLG